MDNNTNINAKIKAAYERLDRCHTCIHSKKYTLKSGVIGSTCLLPDEDNGSGTRWFECVTGSNDYYEKENEH